MGTLTVNATNGQTVAKGATYMVPLPSGKSLGNYQTAGATITTSDGSVYPVTVSFGASGITVTNPTGRDIASGGFDFIDLQTSGILARFNAAGETEVLIGTKNTEAGLVSSTTDPLTGGSELLIADERAAPLIPNQFLMVSGATGADTGWVPTAAFPEKFSLQLLIATGGAAASLTLDGSNDGLTSAGQVATASLDTTGTTLITPPIKPIYKYIKWTVVSAGSGTIQIGRGA